MSRHRRQVACTCGGPVLVESWGREYRVRCKACRHRWITANPPRLPKAVPIKPPREMIPREAFVAEVPGTGLELTAVHAARFAEVRRHTNGRMPRR